VGSTSRVVGISNLLPPMFFSVEGVLEWGRARVLTRASSSHSWRRGYSLVGTAARGVLAATKASEVALVT